MKPKKNVETINPVNRKCEFCPRWKTMCQGIYSETGQLPDIDFCPIWNGSYDIQTKLWSHQTEDDIIKEDVPDIDKKVEKFIVNINNDYDVVSDYVKLDDGKIIINVTFKEHERINEILHIHIETRKIDFFIHDDEYIHKLLKANGLEEIFTRIYHYLKNKFKKLQLRGTSNNRIHMEMYDLLKLDEHLYSMVEAYHKVLAILDFEFTELSSKRLKKIFGDEEV